MKRKIHASIFLIVVLQLSLNIQTINAPEGEPNVSTVSVYDDFEDGVQDTDSWDLFAKEYEANFTITEEGGMLNYTNADMDGWICGVGTTTALDTSVDSFEMKWTINTYANSTGQETDQSMHDHWFWMLNGSSESPEDDFEYTMYGLSISAGFEQPAQGGWWEVGMLYVFNETLDEIEKFTINTFIQDATPSFKLSRSSDTWVYYWVNDYNATPTTDVQLATWTHAFDNDDYYFYAGNYPSGNDANTEFAGICHWQHSESTSNIISDEAYAVDRLSFTVTTTYPFSTVAVDCGTEGEPTIISGVDSWSYDTNTNICTVTVKHSSSQEVVVDWSETIPETFASTLRNNFYLVFGLISLAPIVVASMILVALVKGREDLDMTAIFGLTGFFIALIIGFIILLYVMNALI